MIAVRPDLEARLKARAQEDGISMDAYLERLLADEEAQIAHTEALLREAAQSGDYIELTESEWDAIERDASELA